MSEKKSHRFVDIIFIVRYDCAVTGGETCLEIGQKI